MRLEKRGDALVIVANASFGWVVQVFLKKSSLFARTRSIIDL